MLKTLRNRLSKLEAVKSTGEFQYQLAVTIICPDDASDAYIEARQKAEPHKRFIRFGDFADECV